MNKSLNPTSYPTSMEQTRIKFEEKMNRLFLAVGVKNDSELARFLGITPQSVGPARKKLQIPSSWIEKIAETTNISSDWLFFGRGPMRPEDAPRPTKPAQLRPETTTETAGCARCAKMEMKMERLEEKLEKVELQRDSLVEKNSALLCENGDLKARCATLEERQKTCCPDPLLRKPQYSEADLRT